MSNIDIKDLMEYTKDFYDNEKTWQENIDILVKQYITNSDFYSYIYKKIESCNIELVSYKQLYGNVVIENGGEFYACENELQEIKKEIDEYRIKLLAIYNQDVLEWLLEKGYKIDVQEFLPKISKNIYETFKHII